MFLDSRTRSAIWTSCPSRKGAVARAWRAGAERRHGVSAFWFSSMSFSISADAKPRAGRYLGIRLAQDARGGALGGQPERAGANLFGDAPQFHGFGFVIGAQPADLPFNRRTFALHFAL